MIFTVADLTVKAENPLPYLLRTHRDYLSPDAQPQLTVTLTETKPIEQSIELLRAVSNELIKKDTFLFHCSALSYEGKAILFAAHSGVGKSTHARMWREEFGDKVTMVNDDKPFLRFEGDTLYVFGSPWDGKHHLSTNTKVPVAALCFIFRGEENRVAPMNAADALNIIFDQVPRTSDPEYMSRLLALLDKMLTRLPLYSLFCRPDHEAARVALKGIIGDEL